MQDNAAAISTVIFALSFVLLSSFAFYEQRRRLEDTLQRSEAQKARAERARADVEKLRVELNVTQRALQNAEAQVAELKAQLQRAQSAARVLEVRGRANSPILNATITPSGQAFATL